MKQFKCSKCGHRVFFENVSCLKCGGRLGFDADVMSVVTLEGGGRKGTAYRLFGLKDGIGLQYCANGVHGVCNWLTPQGNADTLCRGCRLNMTIPNLPEPGSLEAWRQLELAKKRLLYALLRFGLSFDKAGTSHRPLSFEFARNAMTGHLNGVVTVDILEADAVERERQRQYFQEPYRALLGHLRHESGHYYWPNLGGGQLAEFRQLFGDERQDYAAALTRHHASGPPADWSSRHVSAYASAHPWEHWAETWAHYLHLVDAVDTAEAEGLEARAAGILWGAIWPFRSVDVYRKETFAALKERWVPLTVAMNSLTRSMGQDDFYPFVIPAPAYDKLEFVHRCIRAWQV